MVPYLAQGSVMAIEDAWVLAHTLAQHADAAVALKAYEQARLERTANVQRAAWKQGQLNHAVGSGDDIASRGDGGGFADSAWLYGYDVCALYPL